jgi:hypothetical protein
MRERAERKKYTKNYHKPKGNSFALRMKRKKVLNMR